MTDEEIVEKATLNIKELLEFDNYTETILKNILYTALDSKT